MNYLLRAALTLVVIAPALHAGEPVRAPSFVPAGRPSDSACETIHLTVQPMPAPKPALKYQLLPELRELHAGNAAHNYLKCFMEQRTFFHSKEAVADRSRYLMMPLSELPLEKLRDYGGIALRQADWAARLDNLDWQDLLRIQEGGLEQLPAELGSLQILGASLQVRFRAEVAGRRFDDAVRSAKTMFALARHLGEYPSEVANLLALWVAHLGLDAIQEMVQQPGCPNFYWALTDLPCPMVDVRKGVRGESTLIAAELRTIRDDAAMSEADLKKFVSHYSGLQGFARAQAGRSPRNQGHALQSRVQDAEQVRAARRRLIEAGYAESLVKQFPPLQVILLVDKHAYEVQRDERMKLLALPLWQIDSPAGSNAVIRNGDGLFTDLAPEIIQLRRSQAQLEQQIAFLRHIEALRLHTADHEGKLPAKLSEISVPLPPDPFTGKPFTYSMEGKIAHIRGCLSPGDRESSPKIVRYEVTTQR